MSMTPVTDPELLVFMSLSHLFYHSIAQTPAPGSVRFTH